MSGCSIVALSMKETKDYQSTFNVLLENDCSVSVRTVVGGRLCLLRRKAIIDCRVFVEGCASHFLIDFTSPLFSSALHLQLHCKGHRR